MKVNNLVIEKNIIIPPLPSGTNAKGQSKYKRLLKSMDVGDSVLLDFKTYGPRDRKAFQAGIWANSKLLNMKVSSRTIDGEGMRFWRIK